MTSYSIGCRKWILGALLAVFVGLPSSGQTASLAQRLEQALHQVMANDTTGVMELVNSVDKSRLDFMSDSVRYYYYFLNYFNAGIDTDEKIDMVEKAVAIRERSLGVHHAEYLFLCAGLAGLYPFPEELDKRIAVLEKAATIATSVFDRPLLTGPRQNQAYYMGIYYGAVLNDLGTYYEAKEYYELAAIVSSACYRGSMMMFNPNDPQGLGNLDATFSRLMKADNGANRVLTTADELLPIIERRWASFYTITETRTYARILCYKGLAKKELDKTNEALEDWTESIRIIKQLDGVDAKLPLLYESACVAYYELNATEKLDAILAEVEQYYSKRGQSWAYERLKQRCGR